jgi:WhiB family transcriptional regulator, redox-sensing transcriptional regulator
MSTPGVLVRRRGPGWRDEAACRGVDPDVFVPDELSVGGKPADYALALSICAQCPVTAECLAECGHEATGVYGGLTPRQRRAARRTERNLRLVEAS